MNARMFMSAALLALAVSPMFGSPIKTEEKRALKVGEEFSITFDQDASAAKWNLLVGLGESVELVAVKALAMQTFAVSKMQSAKIKFILKAKKVTNKEQTLCFVKIDPKEGVVYAIHNVGYTIAA